MPNIRSFDAPNGLGLNPTETGIDATLQAARRTSQFFNQKADALGQEGQVAASTLRVAGQVAVDYEDHREISAGAATGTALMAQKLSEWNATLKTADPNDPSVAQKFLTENLEPALEQWKSGFNTEKSQQYAEQFTDQLRRDMFHKTAADMSTMAGIAVQQNARTVVNNAASAVSTDPGSLDTTLKMLDHSLGAMADSSPTLDAETGAKVKSSVLQEAKENTVKAAIVSMIAKNPDTDLTAIEKKYGQYLKPGEMQMFQKAAQSQAKVNAYYDRQTQLAAKQQADLKVHTTATKIITDNVSIEPQTGAPIIKPQFFHDALELARQNPDAPSAAATARTMIDWGESQQNKERKVVDDPATVTALSNRLFDPDNPLTELDLMRAQTKGQLSDHTFQQLSRNVKELQNAPLKGPIYQDTMKAVHSALVLTGVGIPGKDDVGEKKYAQFVQSFLPQYLSKYRAGTLEPNALDLNNPDSMISKAMEPFKRTLTDRINDYVSTLGGPTATTTGGVTSRLYGGVPAPVSLGGIASLQRNPVTGEWRDEATGKIYNKDGSPK